MEESINQRFKEIRKKIGLSQTIFAENLGIKQASLSDIERGRTDINSNIMKILAEKFDININWLITGTGDVFITKSDNKRVVSFIDEINLINEINQNRNKVQFYFKKFIEISELLAFIDLGKLAESIPSENKKFAEFGITEKFITEDVLKEHYALNKGIEYYETLNFEEKRDYNDKLKQMIDFMLDSFFNKFKAVYIKFSDEELRNVIRKHMSK